MGLFGSACAGVVMGGLLARLLNNQLLKRLKDFGKRLAAGFSVFGFLCLPSLVGVWSNLHLNAGMAIYSLKTSTLLALLGGGITFMFSPSSSER